MPTRIFLQIERTQGAKNMIQVEYVTDVAEFKLHVKDGKVDTAVWIDREDAAALAIFIQQTLNMD